MGRMTHVGTLKVGTSPVSVALHPNGQFIYVTNLSADPSTNGGVSIRGVDRFNGALTGRGSAQARSWPTAVQSTPLGAAPMWRSSATTPCQSIHLRPMGG